jgi:hypothetical protein
MGPDEREPVLSTVSSVEDDEESEFGQDTDDEDDEEKWLVANLLAQLGVENGRDEENVRLSISTVPIQQPLPIVAPPQMALPQMAPPPMAPQMQSPPMGPLPPMGPPQTSLYNPPPNLQSQGQHQGFGGAPPSLFNHPPNLQSQGQHQASFGTLGAPLPPPRPNSTSALNAPAGPTYDRPIQVQQLGPPFQLQAPLPIRPNYPQLQCLYPEPQAALPPQAVDRPSIFRLIGVLVLTYFVTQLVAKSVYVEGILISIFIAIGLGIGLIFMRSLYLAMNPATRQNHPIYHHDSTRKRDTDDIRQDNRGQNDSILADPPETIPKEAQSMEDQTKAQITATPGANALPPKVPRKSPDLFQQSRQMKARGNIIIITVRGVRYNSYWQKPAALIIFRFEIRRKGREPAQAGTIKINFADSGTTLGPMVSVLFPKHLLGKPSAESHTRGTQITAGMNTSSAFPVAATGNVQGTSQRSFTRDQRLRIDGATDHDKKNGPNSVARWVMTANKVQRDGVPPEFTAGVVISHNKIPFSATVKVTLGSFKWKTPWSNSGVCFNFDAQNVPRDCVIHGMEELGRDFSGLTEEQYKQLAPFDYEYQVSPTGNSRDD